MSNSRVVGRVVPAHEKTRRTVATLGMRPQRIAFLIGKGFAFEDLIRMIRYNTNIWGGIFNALVPTDGDALSKGWWKTLEVHDPDAIVVCGTIGHGLVAEVKRRLQPLLVRGWEGLLIEEHRIDRLNNVRMLPVLANVLEAHRTDDLGSVIRIPVVNPDHPFFPYAVPQFGILDAAHRETYTQQLRAPTVHLGESTDFVSYLDAMSSILQRGYPLQLTGLHLASTILYPESINSRIILCLAGDDYVEDLCAFWTLRMSPRLGQADTIFLPIQPLAVRLAPSFGPRIGKNKVETCRLAWGEKLTPRHIVTSISLNENRCWLGR